MACHDSLNYTGSFDYFTRLHEACCRISSSSVYSYLADAEGGRETFLKSTLPINLNALFSFTCSIDTF